MIVQNTMFILISVAKTCFKPLVYKHILYFTLLLNLADNHLPQNDFVNLKRFFLVFFPPKEIIAEVNNTVFSLLPTYEVEIMSHPELAL